MTEFSLVAELNEYPGGAMDCNVKLLKKLDDNTVMIDGVKYQKVKQEPQSLYEIIKEWNDDDDQPTCEELADKISVWLNENRWNSRNGEYFSGWNECIDDLQLKIK